MVTSESTPSVPSWRRTIEHLEAEADAELASLRRSRATYLEKHARGNGMGINLGLAEFTGLWLLIARGPDLVREELRALAPYARLCVDQFEQYFRPGGPVTTDITKAATAVCLYECLGLEAGDAQSVLRPWLVKVATSRRDEYVFEHWNRALVALALDDRRTWGPIAGFMPDAAIPFTPGATFALNVQGFVAHLAGAVIHRRPADEVLPAWRDLVRCHPHLKRVKMTNSGTLLWGARIVHHHIGGHSLDSVGAYLYDEIRAALAAEETQRQ